MTSTLRRIIRRLIARRGLLGLVVVGLLLLVIASGLTFAAAALGFAIAAVVAGAIPLQDVERPIGGQGKDSDASPFVQVQTLIDALPDAAIILTRNDHVLIANDAAKDYSDSLRRGSHISSVLRTPEFLDALDSLKSRRQPIAVIHAERVPVGRRMEITLAPLDGGSEGAATLVLLRDLSELERVNQMRADFVANASHELRTPLASLRGFIETLQGSAKKDAAAQERFLTIMASQAERMSRLIDDLLSLSRVEMNAHLPLTTVLDVNEVLAHVADTLEPLARERRQTLSVHQTEGRALVRGDRDELVQLFQNLIQNAIKYGREGGRADVTIARAARSEAASLISVGVSDDGPGIAPEHMPRLTERFYRVDVASSREKGGTGLGLAIVKHVLTRHRGELDIRSELGRGSTFIVTLPEAAG